MVSLARNQANASDKLNWFITVADALTDAFEIGFRILDIHNGLPGVQVFPVAAGTYHDVTATAGHFGVGSYYAYDSAAVSGWVVPLAENLGTHEIEWRWKISALASYQYGTEDFEVVTASTGDTISTYCTLQDIRNLGVPLSVSNEKILAAIALSQQLIDRVTRQWFVPKTLQFRFDGTDSDAIHFGVPIISVEWLKTNDSIVNMDTGAYRVYNSLTNYPDDRHNPRIKLINAAGSDQDIYTAPIVSGWLRFRKGRMNQEIRGQFGYVEADLSTPLPIKEACIRMTLERLGSPAYGTPPIILPAPVASGAIVEEWTDGHRLRYSDVTIKPTIQAIRGISKDQFVIDVLRMYKGPIGIATPAHWTYI